MRQLVTLIAAGVAGLVPAAATANQPPPPPPPEAGTPGSPASPAGAPVDAPAPTGAPTPAGAPLPAPTPAPPPAIEHRATGPDALPPGSWRLMLSDLTVLRVNPIGLETRGRFGLQKRLYPSTSKIGKNNFMFAGIYPKLNPASAHLAAGFEIQPLSMFNLRATAELQQYFGSFGYLQSFVSPDANYSDATLADLADNPAREPQAAKVFHAAIQPLLQVRVGPIAIRAQMMIDYWDLDIRSGDGAAYEATFDTLLPDRGWTIATDTDVLYAGRPGLAIGLRHTWVRPFYQRRHFADPLLSDAENQAAFDDHDNRNAHHRLGLFAAYTLRDRGPSRFNKPTVILIASWYLSHRFRTGEPGTLPADGRADDYTSRGIPYLLAGFAFESDFLPVQ